MKRSLITFLSVLLFAFGLIAQTTTSGDVAGTVTDPSGAVVPNAPVTLVNDATGQTVNVTTNNSGFYRASSLKPGAYTVAATVQGFSPSKRRVDVAVGTITTVNLALGNVSAQTTVEVTAEAPVIQTENGNISNTHDTREIELVPNGGGDTSFVAQTTPGITMNTATGTGYGNFSAFGLPGTANLFTTNGNDAMDPYLNLNNSGATNLTLGANELAEVSVVSNGYSVQYGRQAGAQVNSVTKSGSNGFHGNAVYYWNGRALNADNWFNKHVDASAGQTPTPTGFVNANQWSASFGGPIKKDKTFFFVDTEGLRIVVPVPAQVFTPTQAYEGFVLSTLGSVGQGAQVPFYQNIFNIYNGAPGNNNSRPVNASDDPALGCGDLVDPTNTNPVAVSAQGLGFGAAVPCAQTYHSDFPNFAHEWTLAARVDHQLSSADRMYVRYHMDRGLQPTYTDPLSPVFNTNSSQPSYDGQFNETHAFGTKAVNQFILSGTYYRAVFVSNNQAQALATYPSSLLWGDGLFANVGGDDFNFPQGRSVTQYQAVDDLSINFGNHTLKLGTNFRRNDITDFTTGVLTVPEQLVNSMTNFSQGLSDFLRQRFPQRTSNPVAIWSAGWYGEDDWRATDRLKLTLGLRIDHDSNPVCQTNCFNRLTQPFQAIAKGADVPYNQVIQSGVHQAYRDTDPLLWQPRVGFAWQPFGNGRSMVIRGGAGLFYDLVPGTLADNFINNAPGNLDLRDAPTATAPHNFFAPGVPGSTYTVLANSAAAFRQQFASGGSFNSIRTGPNAVPLFTGLSFQDASSTTKTPQFQEWNLEIQQAIGAKTSVSANYVGNHGLHIPVYDGFLNARCASATGCANVRSVLPASSPDAAFTSVRQLEPIGYSHYNGLVLAFQRKFSAGLQTQFSYTWSHATDTVSNGGVLPWSIDDSLQTLISPFGQDLNYGNSDYDARHSLNANYVYELPFKFGNGFLNNLIGGWTVSGTFFYHTGFPFTVTDSTALAGLVGNGTGIALPANIASSVDFMACTSGPSIDVNAPGCLSKSQFKGVNSTTFPIPAYYSNQRRNQFIGPHYFNTDLSLRKAFKLTERFRLSVGANAYNVLNHPNFGNPTVTLSGSTGSFYTTVAPPTSALGAFLGGDASARSVQLEGRLTF